MKALHNSSLGYPNRRSITSRLGFKQDPLSGVVAGCCCEDLNPGPRMLKVCIIMIDMTNDVGNRGIKLCSVSGGVDELKQHRAL